MIQVNRCYPLKKRFTIKQRSGARAAAEQRLFSGVFKEGLCGRDGRPETCPVASSRQREWGKHRPSGESSMAPGKVFQRTSARAGKGAGEVAREDGGEAASGHPASRLGGCPAAIRDGAHPDISPAAELKIRRWKQTRLQPRRPASPQYQNQSHH